MQITIYHYAAPQRLKQASKNSRKGLRARGRYGKGRRKTRKEKWRD